MNPPDPPTDGTRRRAWAALVTVTLLSGVLLGWQAGEQGRLLAMAELNRSAGVAATLHAQALRSEVERLRALPLVLAEDADIRSLLRTPQDAAALARVDAMLLRLAQGTGAAVLYLIGSDGRAIAASNYREAQSFVGVDYRFRRYYRAALSDGAHEQFAMGSISHRPGLYLARRVGDADAPLGVVVVKLEFDGLEAEWRRDATQVYVTDADGVLLIGSNPDWRFATTAPLDAARQQALRESLQFGEAPLSPLAVQARGDRWLLPGSPAALTRQSVAVPDTPWTLTLYAPLAPGVPRAVLQMRLIGLLLSLALGTVAGIMLARHQRRRREAQRQADMRRELEHQVALRTQALRNEEAQRRQLHDELMFAARLATLGQITTSVAHEINQPLAAIRAYADNGRVLLARERPAEATENFATIASLCERMGAVTQQLRGYGRRGSGVPEPVSLEQAVDGALAIVEHRLRRAGVWLQRSPRRDSLRVLAELMPLEQVLVNLLQNAIEACENTPSPRIEVLLTSAGGRVELSVADNGPGLSADAAATLFKAFATTKPEGLGLGLSISRDIVERYGGRLRGRNRSNGEGAEFLIDLPEC